MRILIVEDEPKIAAEIARGVESLGLTAESVGDGEEAWYRGGTESYGAIVLDVGLPKIDGITLLKRWRQEGLATPVLVLTARGSWSERVEGIDAGADDYLPKPFRMEELLARLRAILRRAGGHASSIVTIGEVAIDTRNMRVSVKGTPVSLTPLEFRLINYLAHNRDRVVPQAELCDNLYDINNDRDPNAIEAVVARLRRKIKVPLIETRRGFGYHIAGPQE
ncbi:MAG: response regulator transcription factor [Rhizobiales bacterium]|nr:response regulator transcription factor [Hyphomicrobiales bacterium]